MTRTAFRIALAAGLTCAPAAAAQVSFKGGPEELGQELIRRTQSAAYPMFGYDLSEIQEGAARLRSKDPDDWASLWSEFGEKHFAAGRAAERGGNAPLAQREYSAAFDWFSLARWPAPQTTRRRLAYDRSLEAFQAYDRLNDPPLQTLRISFGTQTVTALLRTPKGAGPFPLFIQIGGLDGYKELLARGQSVSLAQAGVATLMLDSPGTGQGVKITPEAWRSLQVTIEAVLRQPDIDAKRVVLWGGSFGGYWATLLAYRMPDAFRGVVAHGGPLGIAEMPLTDEYLFDQDIALTYAVQGARNWTDARRLTRGLNLARSGVLSGRTPPMLLLNGAKDTLVPIADLYAVLRSGETPKDAWVNPQGVHLGRQAGVWTFGKISETITMPWVYAHLGMAKPVLAHASDIP